MCIACSELEHPKRENVVVRTVVSVRMLLTLVIARLVLMPVGSVVGVAIGR